MPTRIGLVGGGRRKRLAHKLEEEAKEASWRVRLEGGGGGHAKAWRLNEEGRGGRELAQGRDLAQGSELAQCLRKEEEEEASWRGA